MTDRKKPGVLFWATVVLVVLLVGYGCAYALTVRPLRGLWDQGIGCIPVYVPPGSRDFSYQKFWLKDQKFWSAFFRPAHWVDTRIRRETWRFVAL